MLSHQSIEQIEQKASTLEKLDHLLKEAKDTGQLKAVKDFLMVHPLLAEDAGVVDKEESKLVSAQDLHLYIPSPHDKDLAEGGSQLQLPIPVLPHEILLMIKDYIRDGNTFMNRIEALLDYPTAGDLPKLFHIKNEMGLKNHLMWPTLYLEFVKETLSNARILSHVSHLFKDISFNSMWSAHLVRIAVQCFKPCVSVEMDGDIKIDEGLIASLVECHIHDLSIGEPGGSKISLDSTIAMTLFSCLPEIAGLTWLSLNSLEIPLADKDQCSAILCDSLKASKITDLILVDIPISFPILADSLATTKLSYLYIGLFAISLSDITTLSQTLSPSVYLKTLQFSECIFEDRSQEECMKSLTDGLVNSNVSELTFTACHLERNHIQYLMDHLSDLKSLKKLYFEADGWEECMKFEDAPFYLKSVLKSPITVDMDIKSDEEEEGFVCEYELTDLAQKYKVFKETYSKKEREFFHRIFKHDDDSIFP